MRTRVCQRLWAAVGRFYLPTPQQLNTPGNMWFWSPVQMPIDMPDGFDAEGRLVSSQVAPFGPAQVASSLQRFEHIDSPV